MATNTKNYNLVKPAGNELADISVINKNMDTIDEQLIPVNSLTSEDSKKALAAVQGKVLNEKVGDLSALNTVHKKNLVQAINEAAEGSGITVVTENEYEAMQEAGSIDPDKLYGIVDAYDFSAGNVEISDDLATKLDLATNKTVENAINTVNTKINQSKDSVVKNAKDISVLNQSLSDVFKKDGSVQMTGVLKTVGNSVIQDIVSGNNGMFSYNNRYIITSNCYWDGSAWRYSSDGKAMYMWIDADTSAVAITKWIAGVKDALVTTQDTTETLLTNLTGLPLTGGTLSGSVIVDTGGWAALCVRDLSINRQMSLYCDHEHPFGMLVNSKASAPGANQLNFQIGNEDTALNDMLRFFTVKNGAWAGPYNVYHTGNITVSASAPSTALAEGCQHQVY